MVYAKDVGIGTKAFLIQLKKDHPYLFEQIMYREYGYGVDDEGYYLIEPWTESEREMPKDLRRTREERIVRLQGSKGIELQIFDLKRYIDSHKNKTASRMCYNMDYLMIDKSLHKGEWRNFSYDVSNKESPDWYFMTPQMSAAQWRKILNAMLCILKKQYREAKAEERKPKPRKPRRVPFKQSMYATAS
jgi:hypothetical protein